MQLASAGPFAQFQNSDDSDESLTQLVMQLVSRIPHAEPDRDVVKMQVGSFKSKIAPLLTAQDGSDQEQEQESDEASVAKIFEEIKVMFQDLPSRIEQRIEPRSTRSDSRLRHMQFRMMDEIVEGDKEATSSLKILMIASQFRDEIPWLYDVAAEVYRKIESGSPDRVKSVQKLIHIFEITLHHPYWREFRFRSKERGFVFEENLDFAMHSLMRLSSELEKDFHRVRSENAKESSQLLEARKGFRAPPKAK